ncbi:MAG TPA: polyprenol phosphomannose-dependent alpha 1,6 mannosyltransferase MptB [Rugosimonospora sp.]|nr:polyprenol phosphomannose-dependent alpha 1,6 mannosyltransferase MptB [Rugosimonospora sp.]
MRFTEDIAGLRALGTVGSVAVAVGGYAAGALPWRSAGPVPGLGHLSRYPSAGVACVYFGLVLLVAAWWRLLRRMRTDPAVGTRGLLVTFAAWAVPLALAPPLFSRDVYSYLAQGTMAGAGADVYHAGAASLGGGLSLEVPAVWQHTPCPYGPVFLVLAVAVVAVTKANVVAGILALRLVALAAVGLIVAVLPGLARRCGVDPGSALALGVLNPLVLLHLVAGAHNDAVMLALLCAGLAATARRWVVPGAALVTVAALVKAPAGLGLLAVVELCAARTGNRTRAALTTVAVAAATTAGVTSLAGTGYGWIGALGTPVSAHSWSVSGMLGRATGAVLDLVDSDLARLAVPGWMWLCGCAAVAIVAVVWWHGRRLGAVYALGLSLSAVALLGPATRPWYALWGLLPVAAAAPRGLLRRAATITSGVLALMVLPDGVWPTLGEIELAVQGGLLALAVLWYLGHGFAPATWNVPRAPRLDHPVRQPG